MKNNTPQAEEYRDDTICIKCQQKLLCHEIEIFNFPYEVGGYCENKQCERYLLLVI